MKKPATTKLSLNRHTVAVLGGSHLTAVAGGVITSCTPACNITQASLCGDRRAACPVNPFTVEC
jgi:hypothetical protein